MSSLTNRLRNWWHGLPAETQWKTPAEWAKSDFEAMARSTATDQAIEWEFGHLPEEKKAELRAYRDRLFGGQK